MNFTDVLSGSAGLAGVQWALLDPQPHEALRQVLQALLPAVVLLGPCRLHRAKYKPGRHLTAHYEVSIHDQKTGKDTSRQIEASWRPPGGQAQRGSMADLQNIQAEAIRRGLAAPFSQLTAESPEWGMRVQIAPLDVAFPQLVPASDPRYVRDMLASAFSSEGREPAQTLAAGYEVTAIRYRPGQRHVLRYDPLGANGSAEDSGTMFAKIYNSEKGARTFGVVRRVADWLETHAAGISTVRPLAYIAGDGVMLYPRVSGTPLSQLLRDPGQATAQHLLQTGAALRALHGTPTTLIELQPHSFAKEIKGIISASEHVRSLLPATGATIDAILDRAKALHERLPHEPPAFAYGDFKADHLWVTAAGLTLIDFDTCYLFDPAIDVGKFLADLQWWYDGYGLPDVERAQEQFLSGYAPEAPPERILRGRLYEVLVLVKTTARRVRLFDADWAPRTERLIKRADALLSQLEA